MARNARMITRTIKVYDCECLTLNLTTEAASREHYYLTGQIKSKDEALKLLKKANTNGNIEIVAVVNITKSEKLMGMTESTFVEYATELPARWAKPDNESESE